ncbi:MAG: hypothetical protein WCP81_08435 [Actinomycetes bacterium]
MLTAFTLPSAHDVSARDANPWTKKLYFLKSDVRNFGNLNETPRIRMGKMLAQRVLVRWTTYMVPLFGTVDTQKTDSA